MLELGMKGSAVVRPPWEGGPAVTFELVSKKVRFISIDLAIGIYLVHWPPPTVAAPRPAAVKPNTNVQLVSKNREQQPSILANFVCPSREGHHGKHRQRRGMPTKGPPAGQVLQGKIWRVVPIGLVPLEDHYPSYE